MWPGIHRPLRADPERSESFVDDSGISQATTDRARTAATTSTPRASGADPPTVVVGVDGSAASRAAIGWAAQYAQATGAVIHAVLAWQAPGLIGRTAELAGVDYEAAGRRALEDALVTGLPERCPLDVKEEVINGGASGVLLKAARTADLLVLGGSRHGELTGLVLGSVSLTCVTYAHCPVVVVRA